MSAVAASAATRESFPRALESSRSAFGGFLGRFGGFWAVLRQRIRKFVFRGLGYDLVCQEWLAGKLGMKSAANVSQPLRRLDGKSAMKKVPEDLKHFLEEADVTKS